MRYCSELEWLPTGFKEAIEEAIVCADLGREEALRRQMALAPICDEMFTKAQAYLGMSESDITEEYLRHEVSDSPGSA